MTLLSGGVRLKSPYDACNPDALGGENFIARWLIKIGSSRSASSAEGLARSRTEPGSQLRRLTKIGPSKSRRLRRSQAAVRRRRARKSCRVKQGRRASAPACMGCPARVGAISAIIPATANDQSRHYDCGGRSANGASTTLRLSLHYERRAASRNILLMAAPTARVSPAYRTEGRNCAAVRNSDPRSAAARARRGPAIPLTSAVS